MSAHIEELKGAIEYLKNSTDNCGFPRARARLEVELMKLELEEEKVDKATL